MPKTLNRPKRTIITNFVMLCSKQQHIEGSVLKHGATKVRYKYFTRMGDVTKCVNHYELIRDPKYNYR